MKTHTLPYSTTGQSRSWTYSWTSTGTLESSDGPRTDVADVTAFAYDARQSQLGHQCLGPGDGDHRARRLGAAAHVGAH